MNVEVLSEKPDVSKKYRLHHGGKILIVTFDLTQKIVETRVDSRIGQRRVNQETTSLYAKARELMVDESSRARSNLEYIFVTQNEKMKLWALAAGVSLFNWYQSGEEWDQIFRAYATISHS